MEHEELMATVHRLMDAEASDLTCEQPGHADGHTCVLVSDSGADPSRAFRSRYPGMYWRGEPPGRRRREADHPGAGRSDRRDVVGGAAGRDHGRAAVARSRARLGEYHADHDMAFGDEHPPFPAPGGLIPWSNNEHQETYFWITEGPDPDRWPVYAVDSLDEGRRFDCTATEFLFRQMTDQEHPFHTAAEGVRGHWFQ